MSSVRPGTARVSCGFEAMARLGARMAGEGVEQGVGVKICGVTQPEHILAAAEGGARYVGLVFEPRSPRAVTVEQAVELSNALALGSDKIVGRVGLFVDPSIETLEGVLEAVPLDLIQLHGSETPERVAEVRAKTQLPVMKAISIAEASDVAAIDRYSDVADVILVDAKPPKDGDLKGGTGLSFDWSLLSDVVWRTPWMLAGGLTPENVASAIEATGAPVVDVSSGVEASRGVKDVAKIRAFLDAARCAAPNACDR